MTRNRYAVVGVGKYGTRIALELAERGAEVIAMDRANERIEAISDDVALAITLDGTDIKALKGQHIEDMDAVVVAIGDDFESTVLVALHLLDLNAERVIVRASGEHQVRILKGIGVQEIMTPESEFASIVAERLMNPSLGGFLELPDDYEIAEIKAPAKCMDRALGDIDLVTRYNLQLITIRRTYTSKDGQSQEDHLIGIPKADTVVEASDMLVVFGTEHNVNRFLEVNS
jgi:trk system potassium uptake protein TrkA